MKQRPQHHPVRLAAAAAGGLGLLLSGCGGGSGPSGSPVTVTVTPTVTAHSGKATSTPTTAATATSDDVGRSFDYGKVVKTTTVAGVTVLVLDRYTWKGLDDAKLAKQGLPVGPFKKGQVPYENLNTSLTYRLPLADGARILYQHCVAVDQPLQTKSISPTDLLGLKPPEDTVVVSLDAQGRATVVENIPGCP